MGSFHIKSLFLGLGIGMILTSTISIIYLAGMDPAGNLSEEQIVKLAEKYGMVKSASLIDNGSGREEQKAAENAKDGEENKGYIDNMDNEDSVDNKENIGNRDNINNVNNRNNVDNRDDLNNRDKMDAKDNIDTKYNVDIKDNIDNKNSEENKGSEKVENAKDAGDAENDKAGGYNGENLALEEEEIDIRVNPGDSAKTVANKLLKAGLISDKDNFIKQVKDLGLSGKIRVGQFKIKKGADIGSIIQTLTSKKKR